MKKISGSPARFKAGNLEICEKLSMLTKTSMEVAELNPFLDEKNILVERTVMLVQSAFGRSIR